MILASFIAGCGGFLGLSGDDEIDEEAPPPPANVDGSVDGSIDGRDDEGGNAGSADAGDGGTKDATFTGSDGAADAKTDATDGSSVPASKYVFITSMLYAGSFGSAGQDAAGADADALCKARGDASQLSKIKGRTWRAWVSTSSPAENAAVRIVGSTGSLPYRLPDETVVADNRNDLIDGTLDHAIDRDESGVAVTDSPVWTGSSSNGTLIAVNCSDWTSVAGGQTGKVGSSASVNGAWSDSMDRSCAQSARLYCFEF